MLVIKEIPSSLGSFPTALICAIATSTYACFRDSLNSGKDTLFLTANLTSGFNKYLNAAKRLVFTDCIMISHITRKIVTIFTG
jgi:hypothetical protein